MTNQTKNSMLLMLCAMIWGTAFVAQSAGSGMGAFSFLAGRSWMAVLVLIRRNVPKLSGIVDAEQAQDTVRG